MQPTAAFLSPPRLPQRGCFAKLPPLNDEAKAKAAEAADKAGLDRQGRPFQLCKAMDRVAATVPHAGAGRGQGGVGPHAHAALHRSRPLRLHAAGEKPLEASGAHSPPGMPPRPRARTCRGASRSPRQEALSPRKPVPGAIIPPPAGVRCCAVTLPTPTR